MTWTENLLHGSNQKYLHGQHRLSSQPNNCDEGTYIRFVLPMFIISSKLYTICHKNTYSSLIGLLQVQHGDNNIY